MAGTALLTRQTFVFDPGTTTRMKAADVFRHHPCIGPLRGRRPTTGPARLLRGRLVQVRQCG